MIDYKQLKFYAELKGLTVTKHTAWHCQVRGQYDVNVYLTTDRIYIKGLNHSSKVFDHVEVVDYATGDRFPSGIKRTAVKPTRRVSTT